MIIVDNIAENFCRQPRNGIEIATWTGNECDGTSFDVELNYLQRLLLNMVQSKPADLREKLENLFMEENRLEYYGLFKIESSIAIFPMSCNSLINFNKLIKIVPKGLI
mgnify:CR=1 FL=1